MLARSQLGETSEALGEEDESYGGELFLMAVGALYLSLNIAPTEEMVLLAYTMSPWQEVGLLLLSLCLMHAFVYSVDFKGGSRSAGRSFAGLFLRFTCAGYAVVLLVSLGVLWLFDQTGGAPLHEIISTTIVLAFPGALGAAAARVVL